MPRQVTIDQLEAQGLEAVERCRRLVADLGEKQLLWRPSASSWSIAECIQHLNATLSSYQSTMRVSFERERQNAPLAPSTFRVGFLASQFVAYLEPPYRMKSKATKALLPDPDFAPAKVVEEFIHSRQELIAFVREACRVDMSSIRFASPIAKVLKFSLTEAFLVMLAHDRRHLWQAENVKKHPGFPST